MALGQIFGDGERFPDRRVAILENRHLTGRRESAEGFVARHGGERHDALVERNVELAHEFINFVLSKEVQQKTAENAVDAPVVKAVTLTPEQAKQWTYGADMIASLKQVDYEKLNTAKTDWVDRWNEVFGM